MDDTPDDATSDPTHATGPGAPSADEPVVSRSERRAAARRSRRRWLVVLGSLAVILLAAAVAIGFVLVEREHSTSASPPTSLAKSAPSTTSTTHGPTTTTTQAPGLGFTAGKISAVGDSVMLDYADPLEKLLPGINVDAAVSRQWATGEQILSQDKASGQLGATVIVALGTNGPIASSDVDAMMSILSGASKVIFVNTHVDQPWQDPNNQVLSQAPARYKNVTVVDWNSLASQHPEWFGSDGTHLAIDGTGAQALAQLVANAVG